MKKIFTVSIISLSLVCLLTGCSSKKTLTCTISEDTNSMLSMSQTVNAVFSGSKVTNLNQNIKMTVNDEYTSYIDQMADGVRNQYADIKDKSGVEFDVKVTDNVIDTTLNAELAKLDDETKNKLKITNYDSVNYEDAKKELEELGYTCK